MSSKELLQKTAAELRREADALRSEIRDLRFKIATRQHTKVHVMGEKRRQLARIETVLATKSET
jgi:ribosomal protein L29